MSLFHLKNSFGSKMKKGFRNFCSGEDSTSTLDPKKIDLRGAAERNPVVNSPSRETRPTLEEMITRLEMEEKMNMKGGFQHRRMSCVDSSDILRTARRASSQHARFSLDGKDAAVYRSSEAEKIRRSSPRVIGGKGEGVIWCKPGVVPRLMGLDAMPLPSNSSVYRRDNMLGAIMRNQKLRMTVERHEKDRRRRRLVVADVIELS